jgi:hypothetical protein
VFVLTLRRSWRILTQQATEYLNCLVKTGPEFIGPELRRKRFGDHPIESVLGNDAMETVADHEFNLPFVEYNEDEDSIVKTLFSDAVLVEVIDGELPWVLDIMD